MKRNTRLKLSAAIIAQMAVIGKSEGAIVGRHTRYDVQDGYEKEVQSISDMPITNGLYGRRMSVSQQSTVSVIK